MSFLVHCPNCGERTVYEFRFGGEYRERPSMESSSDQWAEYLYARENTAGISTEWWYHRLGCRRWFLVSRDLRNNVVLGVCWPEDAAELLTTRWEGILDG
jgi:heterotetrameric sarcosine oxidase delta subunit